MLRLFPANQKLLNKSDIEKQIKSKLSTIEVLMKELQQRKPFLANIVKNNDASNSLDILDIQKKINSNQDALVELFKERESAYLFMASIPVSLILSAVSHSLGFSMLKYMLTIYQGGAALLLKLNYDLPYVKVPMVDFLTSSAPDKLYECNAELLNLCGSWIKAPQAIDFEEEVESMLQKRA